MLEVELKSVDDDPALRRARIERAGAKLTFVGRLEDRRYDLPDRSLTERDNVLRVRTYRDDRTLLSRSQVDWKGPTRREGGYKLRDEIELKVEDDEALVSILHNLGYCITTAIDRDIAQYDLEGTMIRFEHYPRMDDLVEVEGSPEQIETAIAALGLPREGFTTDRLSDFCARFAAREQQPAVLRFTEL